MTPDLNFFKKILGPTLPITVLNTSPEPNPDESHYSSSNESSGFVDSMYASALNCGSKAEAMLRYGDAGPFDLVKYPTPRSPGSLAGQPYENGDSHAGKIRNSLSSQFRSNTIISGNCRYLCQIRTKFLYPPT